LLRYLRRPLCGGEEEVECFQKSLLLARANRANSFNDVEKARRPLTPIQPSLLNVSTKRIMHTSGGLKSEEANGAAWAAGRGAVAGAAKVWNCFDFNNHH
jgi:hypothetical protein